MSAKNLLNGDLSAHSVLRSSHKLNGSSSSNPSIHDASSLADIRASLAALHTREAAITNSLDSLISSQADLSRELGRLDILRANLSSQVIATRSISNGMLSSAAETAGRLSNRVKELDLEKDRVQQTLKVVEQVAELKACVHGVVGSMGAPQDWEAAAGYISRASKVPEPIIRGGFAASIVPSVEVPDAPWVTLENSKESLCGLFLREFEKAVKDNDGAKITRFFKLFPLIGRGDVGLDVYGRYVCQGVAGTARATLKEVPGGAGRKDGHGGLVERHYGEGKMIRVIERLQMEADVQGGIILDSWSDDRNVSRRLTDVKSYPFSFLVQSFLPQQKTLGGTPRVNSPAIGGGTNPRDSEDEGVNMKEIDGLLNEISVMLGRWSLYTRFLAGKCKSPETPENTTLPIPSVLSNSNLQRKVSAKLVEPYNFMSTFFFRRSVEKAFQLDESPPGLSLNLSKPIEANAPFIISAVDDVMYIVSAVIQRSISTSQREVVSHVVSTSGRVLESDFIKMMHQKMQNESYPRAVVQGGLPPEDKIVAFIVLINSLDVSNEYLARIITTRLGSSPDQPNGASHPNPIVASFPFENDVTLVTSSLRNLHSTFTTKTTELLNDGLQVLFNQVVRQRLRTIMAEAFRDADYWRTEEELAEIALQNDEDEDELLDRVPRRFEQGWDALMKPIARLMTAKSYNTLLEITAAHLSKQSLEKRISSYSGKTNAYGAIRMERDFNGIISTVAKGNYSVRELFNRVTQILMIANMEDDEWEELADAGDDGGIDWVLSQEERRRARNLIHDSNLYLSIVAVHGLGSNVDWSWTWQDKKGHRPPVHWLKDPNMLPNVMPHARIIAYNYESRWHADAPKTRLELCGEELVKSLHSFRTDCPGRPIIFIAHSIGGLVVLHGLLYASHTEQFRCLPASTVGFAPLGTPFRGTKMQTLAKKVAWLMAPMGSHNGIVTELEQDGKHLADKVHAFSQLRNKLDMPTTCFFELYDSDFGKKIAFPGWARGRFEGPDDRSFRIISNELRNMCTNRKSVIERRERSLKNPGHYKEYPNLSKAAQNCHFMVPFGRNDNFVGRDAILGQLLERVLPEANKDDCQRTAIEGLGGIGKTQIALETVYQIRDQCLDCSIFWVPAVNLTSFENAYREIGRLLQLPGIDDEKTDIRALVKECLSHKNAGSWLLVIDNADDIDILFTSPNLVDYLPFSREGSILFTTRNHEVTVRLDISKGNIVAMPDMDSAEATRLLQIGLKESQIEDTEATKCLLDFLTHLPLAIKQASAYMALNTNVTVSQYLEFCRGSNADLIELLSRQFEDRHRYKGLAKTQNPVATTWLISFEHISQHHPLAADYLKFICFLAEKDIPLSLLPVTSKRKMAEAIGSLKAYAFILERGTPDSFDIHRLVRVVMRNWLQEEGEWDEWITKVVRRLTEEYPVPVHENRRTWARYLPHGEAVLGIDGAINPAEGVGTCLHFNIAETYMALGKYNEAESLYRRTMAKAEALGREHLDIAYMNNLGSALGSQGKYEEAEKVYRQLVGPTEGVLHNKNPNSLCSKHNLAMVLHDQGKYEEAEKIYRQTLMLQEEVLGKRHPRTLNNISHLALTLASQGKYEEAEEMQRQSLKLQEKTLGKEHPDTIGGIIMLAIILSNQKKHEEAKQEFRQALELSERVLGKEHPNTIGYISKFAITLSNQKKYEEAEQKFWHTLKLRERVLGKEHPDTLCRMNDITQMLLSQGNFEGAEEMLLRMLELKIKVLGEKHPETLIAKNNLAVNLYCEGKYEEAEKTHRETLRLQEEVLGEEHADTINSINNLACTLGRQGKYTEAEDMLGLVEGSPGVITNIEELVMRLAIFKEAKGLLVTRAHERAWNVY
ncbi:hypothetical protein GQX73_g8791 [Xylaria multiplex]|uniref:Conserved oligomeric Golgi complex subunit 4 n=1 Tax=Xylaria multiplex TaxID=323545 RepID=A0A7C8IN95_9PEZI|nr:hypothetical protein GQX73_g8791 [Xylaria multiplex]